MGKSEKYGIMYRLNIVVPRDILYLSVEMTDEPAEAEMVSEEQAALLMGLSFP